jgi:hypothetical protein
MLCVEGCLAECAIQELDDDRNMHGGENVSTFGKQHFHVSFGRIVEGFEHVHVASRGTARGAIAAVPLQYERPTLVSEYINNSLVQLKSPDRVQLVTAFWSGQCCVRNSLLGSGGTSLPCFGRQYMSTCRFGVTGLDTHQLFHLHMAERLESPWATIHCAQCPPLASTHALSLA